MFLRTNFCAKLTKSYWSQLTARGENGNDIFQPYPRPNSFRAVQIYSYPSPNIQHSISYPYPNTQIAYL